MEASINYLAVLVAGIASMGVGFLWYSPVMFAKEWIKLMGYTPESLEKAKQGMGMMYGLSFVGALVMAFVLNHFYQYAAFATGTDAVTSGMQTAFWAWLGFVAPVQMTEVIFGGKNWKLFAINTGYQLVSLLVMGLVLGMWR